MVVNRRKMLYGFTIVVTAPIVLISTVVLGMALSNFLIRGDVLNAFGTFTVLALLIALSFFTVMSAKNGRYLFWTFSMALVVLAYAGGYVGLDALGAVGQGSVTN